MFNHTVDTSLPMDVQAALVMSGLVVSALVITAAAMFIFNCWCLMCSPCEQCSMCSLCEHPCENFRESCCYLVFASFLYALCPCCCKNWRKRLQRIMKQREESLLEEEEYEEQKRIARKFIDALKRKTKKKHLLRDLLKVNLDERTMEWVEENVVPHCENEDEEKLVRERAEEEIKNKGA